MLKKVLIISLIIVVMLFTNIVMVFAATKSELEEKNQNLNSQINKTKEELAGVRENLSETMSEIEELIAEISEYESEIDDLNGQIDELETDIDKAEEELKQAEADFAHQEELLVNRIVTLYELGETTFLDVLLSSKNVTDFFSKYYIMNEIATADKELLDQIEEDKNAIEKAKTDLENSKTKVEALKQNKESTAKALKNSQATKEQYANELTEEEKELKEQLELHEADKRQIERELAALAQSNVSSGKTQVTTGTPSSHGYIFPVEGLSKSNINNPVYPSYAGHTGTDININTRGKNVVAVKAGTVVTSTAATGSIPNYNANGEYVGSYRGYGEYVIIDHHDGTMTLYGHMRAGSRTVSKGQTVVQGQVIGIVGNTGNCQPRPSPSNPHWGTHLHFEVRINGRCVNPLPYL